MSVSLSFSSSDKHNSFARPPHSNIPCIQFFTSLETRSGSHHPAARSLSESNSLSLQSLSKLSTSLSIPSRERSHSNTWEPQLQTRRQRRNIAMPYSRGSKLIKKLRDRKSPNHSNPTHPTYENFFSSSSTSLR